MRKVQVTGLPGAGKTYAITNWLREAPELNYLDIRQLPKGLGNRYRVFQGMLSKAQGNTIGESACGVSLSGSFIVRLDIPIEQIYANCLERDGCVDEDYLSLLKTQMVKPNYTVTSAADLISLFRTLFRGT